MTTPAGQLSLEFPTPTAILADAARHIIDWGTSGTIDRRANALQAQLNDPHTALDMGAQTVREVVRNPASLNLAHLGAGAGAAAVEPYRSTALFGTVLAGIFVGAVGVLVWQRRSQP